MEQIPIEADELVKSIPLFLSAPEVGQMYILQYPTINANTTGLDGEVINARLRPQCKQLELGREIPDNPVFHIGNAEQMALNVDGPNRDERDRDDNAFPSGIMNRSVMRSEGSLQGCECYAVGKRVPGVGIVLSPVNAVLPLRPGLDHMDLFDQRTMKEKKEEQDLEQGTNNTEEKSRRITVKFERAENEKISNARERSYVNQQRIIQDDAWRELQYTGLNDPYGKHLTSQIFHCVESEKIDRFHLPASQYLTLLLQSKNKPQTAISSVVNAAAAAVASTKQLHSDDIPKSVLYAYPVFQQIEKLLRRVGVARFSEIKEYLESDPTRTDGALIEMIQKSATLVQGCWVLKSDLLYPVDNNSDILNKTEAGSLHSNMRLLREEALCKLNQKGYLKREEIDDLFPVEASDLLQMLRGVAKPITVDGQPLIGEWTFLLSTDQTFIEKNTSIVQRYTMKWDFQFQKKN